MIQDPNEMKKEIQAHFNQPIQIAKLNTYKTFKLSVNDFSPKWDRPGPEVGKFDGTVHDPWAGGKKYEEPPAGWIGKALNVSKLGAKDDPWLGTGSDAWPLAYHGVSGDQDFILARIKNVGLQAGPRHAYTPKPAIYCSPKFSIAESFSQGTSSVFGNKDGSSKLII